MKRLATVALAVLFIAGLSSMVMAERTALSIGGKLELLAGYEENTGDNRSNIGEGGNYNRVEEKVNVDIDADMTDNVSVHIGLEQTGAWGALAGYPIDGQNAALAIDEAYVVVKELFLEQLTAKAGVQTVEYSLRNDGNAMFLSQAEMGAWKATLNYDPLYVDVIIGKMLEAGSVHGASDTDLYALAVEYYLENKGKVQVMLFNVNNENAEVSVTEYSAGVTYMVLEDLEVFAQIGGQSGKVGETGGANSKNIDASCMAYNLGCEYTFSKINRKPYVGISYQYFGGDNDTNTGDENWVNFGDVDETIVLEADRDLRDHNRGLGKLLTENYSVIRIVGGCQVDEKTAVDGGIGFFTVVEDKAAAGAIDQAMVGLGVVANETSDSDIGTEIDVKVSHKLTGDLTVGAGIGYVASGDAIANSNLNRLGKHEDEALIVMYASAALSF